MQPSIARSCEHHPSSSLTGPILQPSIARSCEHHPSSSLTCPILQPSISHLKTSLVPQLKDQFSSTVIKLMALCSLWMSVYTPKCSLWMFICRSKCSLWMSTTLYGCLHGCLNHCSCTAPILARGSMAMQTQLKTKVA